MKILHRFYQSIPYCVRVVHITNNSYCAPTVFVKDSAQMGFSDFSNAEHTKTKGPRCLPKMRKKWKTVASVLRVFRVRNPATSKAQNIKTQHLSNRESGSAFRGFRVQDFASYQSQTSTHENSRNCKKWTSILGFRGLEPQVQSPNINTRQLSKLRKVTSILGFRRSGFREYKAKHQHTTTSKIVKSD
jgi:hypothetical protein